MPNEKISTNGLDFPDNFMKIFNYERVREPQMPMKPATIANDVCRCADVECPYRDKCSRYINRDSGDGRISTCATLWCRGHDDDVCTNFIDEGR